MKKYDPIIYSSEDLINFLSAKLAPYRVSRKVIKEMIEGETEFIRTILLGGDKVFLHDLGIFKLGYMSPKPERDVINPIWLYKDKTAPKMIRAQAIDEYNNIKFKAAGSFKKELRDLTYGDAYCESYDDEDEVDADGEEIICE